MASNFIDNPNETIMEQTDIETGYQSHRSSDTVTVGNLKMSAKNRPIKSPEEAPPKPPRTLKRYPSSGNLTIRNNTQTPISGNAGRAGEPGTASTSNNNPAKSQPKSFRGERGNRNVSSSNYVQRNAKSETKIGLAKIVLKSDPKSHPFKTRTVCIEPNGNCKVGRVMGKYRASESNAFFDCKVLSRNHALITYNSDGKFYINDMNSSNGTFVNGRKLTQDLFELHFDDVIRFGVDVFEHSKDEVHGCIKARIEIYSPDGLPIVDRNSVQSPESSTDKCLSSEDLQKMNSLMSEAITRNDVYENDLTKFQEELELCKDEPACTWEAVLARDEAIQHIMNMERKVKILENDLPEEELKNELAALKNEKLAYEKEAETAINRVKLENSETVTKIDQIEIKLASSESSDTELRSVFVGMEIALSEATEQLRLLEMEYNENRIQADEVREQTRVEYEHRINELITRLAEHEEEYLILQSQIDDVVENESARVISNGNTKGPKSVKKRKNTKPIKNSDDDNRKDKKKENPCEDSKDAGLRKSFEGGYVGNFDPIISWNPNTVVEKLYSVEHSLGELQKEINEISDAIDNGYICEDDAAWIVEKMQIQNPILIDTYKSFIESFQNLNFGIGSDIADNTETVSNINWENLTGEDVSLAKSLQTKVRELRFCLFLKNQDIKASYKDLIIKRDAYKEKVDELVRIREAKQQTVQEKREDDTQPKSSRAAGGDHISCDSGVASVRKSSTPSVKRFDKTTETDDIPTKVDFSANTMEYYSESDDDDDLHEYNIRKDALLHEMERVKGGIEEKEILARKYKKHLESLDDENEQLRTNIIEMKKKKHSHSNNTRLMIIILILILGAFAYLAFDILMME